MTLGEIVQSIVMRWSARSAAPPGRVLPTPEQIRWAQAEKEALIRRAQMLDVDIDLERSGR